MTETVSLRTNDIAQILGVTRRTAQKYMDKMGTFRIGNQRRVPLRNLIRFALGGGIPIGQIPKQYRRVLFVGSGRGDRAQEIADRVVRLGILAPETSLVVPPDTIAVQSAVSEFSPIVVILATNKPTLPAIVSDLSNGNFRLRLGMYIDAPSKRGYVDAVSLYQGSAVDYFFDDTDEVVTWVFQQTGGMTWPSSETE